MPSRVGDQLALFPASSEMTNRAPDGACLITAVGKRRDGGTRYWCLSHKADATAKYGRPAGVCRAAHLPVISPDERLSLNIDKYRGGIALWGAVPPVYDTTRLPLDRGIHVHARITADVKAIDKTFRAVTLTGERFPGDGVAVSEVDAIYYMASTIFGFNVNDVSCSLCGYSHLDKDWFSVHPHLRHLCAGCGKTFRDTCVSIGNPVRHVQEVCGINSRQPRKAKRKIRIRQEAYPGGIQIWGSNPAIIWSSKLDEEEGIHVHAFDRDGAEAIEDDTFSEVTLDGVRLDPKMVRTLMAQNALPHLEGRVVSLECDKCGNSEFSVGEGAFTPTTHHRCSKCRKHIRVPGRLRKVIANPMVAILERLAADAPRAPQKNSIGLLPETL